ncbi:MAG: hypothetical protein KAI70_03475 [Candidatus Omnitrophica bacterium]|nr:hypothetical protein [Candidatus Omnitrophota bacterium]
MRDFLKDTKDMYECRYGEEICRDFPRYGEFWSKYIGQRKDNFLKHYEIDSSKTDIARFDEKYENMTLAHYGIFVDLATVRMDFDMLLKNSYKTIDEVLAYWNSVRNIYSKIGDSIYKYKVFLDYAKKVLNIGKAIDSTVNSLEKDLESIKSKRDFVTHFTSFPFIKWGQGGGIRGLRSYKGLRGQVFICNLIWTVRLNPIRIALCYVH